MTASKSSRPIWAPLDPGRGNWSEIINVHPPIIHGWITEAFPLGPAGVIGPLLKDQPATFLLTPAGSLEPERSSFAMILFAKAFQFDLPQHHLTLLCNTDRETEAMLASGLNAATVSQNCLFNEMDYAPLPDIRPEFDAIYNARLSPHKRHHLAAAIDNLALIYYNDEFEFTPARFHTRHALLRELLPTAYFVNELTPHGCAHLPKRDLNRILARARVGLCLSAIEGAMRASIEYLSAGLPVVSTCSLGGRDRYFDDEYCLIVEDDPLQIKQAVDALIARDIPRQYIREKTLAKVYKDRARYIAIVQDAIQRGGGQTQFAPQLETLLRGRGIFRWRSMSEFSGTVLRSLEDKSIS